jgi:two-component system, chemotaxis family, chemotaxis protein CheY
MSGYRFDRLKVLIVDDNSHMRKMLTTILNAFGVTVIHEASDGLIAWEKMRSLNPNIIIVDWMMPGMNGLEFTKTVRTSPESPNPFVPIIMLTGHTQIERVLQARDAGVTEFLAKPISANGVLSRITTVIEHPRSFVRTIEYFGPCRRRRAAEDYSGPERRASAPQDNDCVVLVETRAEIRGAA